MSDDLDIRHGGAVAVDTETLRHVAAGFAGLAGRLEEIHGDLAAERGRVVGTDPGGAGWRFASVVHGSSRAVDAATGLADRLRHAAAVYEVVDLHAQRQAAAAAGDVAAVATIDARLGAVFRRHPFLLFEACAAEAAWLTSGPAELSRQAGSNPLTAFGASAVAASGVLIAVNGRGRVARGAVLTGPAPAVGISLVGAAPTSGRAPTSLVSVVDRMPQAPAQVRVERYAMPDGSTRFAVYVAGTRSVLDGRDPWDSRSNVELYRGERAASYEATVQALRDAGARPGDAVYAVGHSQGGMIASHLAVAGEFDVRALITMGSPVSADVGSHTLSVQLRHTDDPVVALSDGGHPAGVGSDDSFIAERVADPVAGVQDVALAAHNLDEYRETAAMLDRSSDPRAAALGEVFDELGDARSVEVFAYEAVRTGRSVIPAHPGSRPTLPGEPIR